MPEDMFVPIVEFVYGQSMLYGCTGPRRNTPTRYVQIGGRTLVLAVLSRSRASRDVRRVDRVEFRDSGCMTPVQFLGLVGKCRRGRVAGRFCVIWRVRRFGLVLAGDDASREFVVYGGRLVTDPTLRELCLASAGGDTVADAVANDRFFEVYPEGVK